MEGKQSMSLPCDSKEDIHRISESVAVSSSRLTAIEQARIADKQTLDIFMTEMRSATRSLENFVVEGREQLKQSDKNFKLLFQSKRDLSNKINEVEAHIEDRARTRAAACAVRHSEFVEKQFNPIKDKVKELHDDKIARDTKGKIINNLPSIVAGVALLAAFWDKFVHLFSAGKP